jgi:hypothetical protein
MQNLLHQPNSWGDDWLRKLTDSSTQRELFQETSAMEEIVQELMRQQQQQDSVERQLAGPSFQVLALPLSRDKALK